MWVCIVVKACFLLHDYLLIFDVDISEAALCSRAQLPRHACTVKLMHVLHAFQHCATYRCQSTASTTSDRSHVPERPSACRLLSAAARQ